MTPPFLLAHLSDLHLGPLPMPPLGLVNLKRLLGMLNWQRKRKAVHRRDIAARLIADLQRQKADHIAVTGDLANIGLAAEHIAAAEWLAASAPADQVSVVPGNHDIYTALGGLGAIERWRPFMTDDLATGTTEAGRLTGFPYVRRRGPIALVGVNSAVPTRPFKAGGQIGGVQLAALERLLARLGDEGALRVVMIHHPPLPGLASPSKALADAADLAGVLGRVGAELVIHGHNHRSMLTLHPTPSGPIPVVGVPSASAAVALGRESLARYHLFRIAAGQPIEMTARGLTHPDGDVEEISRVTLDAATGASMVSAR